SEEPGCFLMDLDERGETEHLKQLRPILPPKCEFRRGFKACLCPFGDLTFLARLRQGAASAGAGLKPGRAFNLEMRALLYRNFSGAQTVPNLSHSWMDKE
ncbi:unnamed protein product, partial [Bubo scandiacus]